MTVATGVASRLEEVAGVACAVNVPLAYYTRFGLGGPADLVVDAETEAAFVAAAGAVLEPGMPLLVIGGGTNLVVADEGYRGAILRFTGKRITRRGDRVTCESGAVLQDLVDFTIEQGLAGISTMTGVPGWAGGAVYGNAGAYGNSIHAVVGSVRFWDGSSIRTFSNPECRFGYRDSLFKRHKEWTIFSAEFAFTTGDAPELKSKADEILAIRNAKYPPTMKCAGSIFKNLFFTDLPAAARSELPGKIVRDGKVPSAWFLEQVDAKGMRNGGIRVADYHANLIYNEGYGKALEVCEIIDELKSRVRDRFCFDLEEEVQFIGFSR